MTPPTDTDSRLEVLTVEEAAPLLRISRNAAYAAARQWRPTNGQEGLPCIEIGRTFGVARPRLDALLHATDAA